jgi:hypothetical protein
VQLGNRLQLSGGEEKVEAVRKLQFHHMTRHLATNLFGLPGFRCALGVCARVFFGGWARAAKVDTADGRVT